MIATGVVNLRRQIAVQAERLFEPPPEMTIAEWADRERVLSEDAGAVEPGSWHTDRVPYLREIMDALDDPTCSRVVFMKSSQVGGSEVGLNWLGKTIDIDPTPFITLFPTEDSLKNYSTTMLEPMLRDTPSLAGRVVDADGRRDRRNTMKRKVYIGGYWMGLTARSSSQLRSLRAPRAIAEEIDDYDAELKQQGDPMKLLVRAQRAFLRLGTAKTFELSTPTDLEISRISKAYDSSDRRRYHLPCPQCNREQHLVWRDDDGRHRFLYEKEGGERRVTPGSVRYLCEACETQIGEEWRASMLPAGRWIAERPDVHDPRGFHIWTAYSPFVTWDAIVQEFLNSFQSPATLKTFDNLWLGKPWKETADTINPNTLQARVETYGDGIDVPHGVGIVAAAIDVQGDRLEYALWGYGEREESWLIEWSRVEGDPGKDETYDECGMRCFRALEHASGARLRASVLAIDAGYQTTAVWRFVERWRARGLRVLPVVGKEGRGRPLIQRPGPQRMKKARLQARPTYLIGSDEAKTVLLLNRAHLKEPGPGYLHFPDTVDPVFFDQFTAEELKTVYVNRFPVRRWVPIPNRQNHALDLACYALGALHDLGPRTLNQLGAMAQQLSQARPKPGTSAIGSGAVAPRGRGLVSEQTW